MLLDTDVFIDVMRKRPPAVAWMATLPSKPLLSGVAVIEAVFGAESAKDLASVQAARKWFTELWPERSDLAYAADHLGLVRLSDGIDAMDAITAALALRHGLPVATFNLKHFRPVSGLVVVKPYTR